MSLLFASTETRGPAHRWAICSFHHELDIRSRGTIEMYYTFCFGPVVIIVPGFFFYSELR